MLANCVYTQNNSGQNCPRLGRNRFAESAETADGAHIEKIATVVEIAENAEIARAVTKK